MPNLFYRKVLRKLIHFERKRLKIKVTRNCKLLALGNKSDRENLAVT